MGDARGTACALGLPAPMRRTGWIDASEHSCWRRPDPASGARVIDVVADSTAATDTPVPRTQRAARQGGIFYSYRQVSPAEREIELAGRQPIPAATPRDARAGNERLV